MNKTRSVLFIGTVWPEPDSSAAGLRMVQLINFFLEQENEVCFVSSAAESDHSAELASLGVRCEAVHINDSGFDAFISSLNPDIVIFDRFMTEEQFGWRVTDQCPEAVQILDTEDLHFVREGRRLKKTDPYQRDDIPEYLNLDIAKRELSSIYRCDLSLIISEAEMSILKGAGIPDGMLIYIPIFMEPVPGYSSQFEDKDGFFTVGNFRHPPNRDSVQFIYNKIWPLIRKEIPDARMNVYGSYPAEKDLQLNNPESGFVVHGRISDLDRIIRSHRVMLAPLRFGAGLKGKFLSSFCNGVPAVTTSIGAEGIITDDEQWPGYIQEEPTKIASRAVSLYKNESKWRSAQAKIPALLKERFCADKFTPVLRSRIDHLLENLAEHRQHNVTGSLLRYNINRSTKFMSRWIEEKNKTKD